ncbi:MAG: CDP-diacylglycerol--glycerol-3-phosphate 3-phosphatidyltransferase [Alphaproteobacteria bacterium]|nr:MAG: CDP-diacylglycerol--glycerol-3-phosphate 3-phosphatidyltransferase [Alphaproteobacteria bacterium]
MLQLPNFLTLARIALVPLIIACYYAPESLVEVANWTALILFVVGAITDYLDGWAARKYNMTSPLGRFLDPIADKLAVTAVIMMLIMIQRISGVDVVAAYLIIGREILVSGLREFLGETKTPVVIPVSNLAKWKTGFQMGALIALLSIQAWPLLEPLMELADLALWVAAVLSVITGWNYFRAFAQVMFKDANE